LFGLIYDEWYAYRHRFLDQGIFTEWMKWRRDDYNEDAGYKFVVAGKSYKDAWNSLSKIGPFAQSEFSDFLDEVHNCKRYRDVARNYEDVTRVVKEHAPGFLGTVTSGQTVLRRTIFLSRLIGLFAVAVAISMILDSGAIVAIDTAIVQNGALLRTLGMVLAIAGLSIVLGHNVWRGGLLALVLTLVGWLTLLRGVFALWAPSEWVMQLLAKSHYAEWLYWYAGFILLIGIYLTVSGFLQWPGAPSSDAARVAGAEAGTTPTAVTLPAAAISVASAPAPTPAAPTAAAAGAPAATAPATATPAATPPIDAVPEARTPAEGLPEAETSAGASSAAGAAADDADLHENAVQHDSGYAPLLPLLAIFRGR
jgi:hypothetical protein